MRKRIAALAIPVTLLWASTTSAQPQPKPKTVDERLKELSTRVDEAMRSAADSAAALKALQDLQRQVTDLRQEVDRQKDIRRGYQETRRVLEQMESRLGNAELQLAASKLEMAGRGEIAGYDDGFYLQTPNRRFMIRFNGLLQAGYEGKIGEGRLYSDGLIDSGAAMLTLKQATQLSDDQSTFLIRRAAMAFSGHLFLREFAYRLELDFGAQDPGPLLEGWAEIRLHRALALRGGKQKVPIGRQMLLHSSRLQFGERSGPVLAFAPGWDLGGLLHGEIPIKGGLSYQVGVFNGAGPKSTENDNIDLLYAVRVAAEPLGRLSEGEGDPEVSPFRFGIGASFAYNLVPTDLALRRVATDPATVSRLSDKDGDGKVDNVAVYTVGADIAARFAGASVQSEFFYRREDPGHIGGDEKLFGSNWGVYVQAGYVMPFLRSLEAAARYSTWEPNYYGESRSIYRAGRVTEVAAVVNLLMWRRLLKWQLEYNHQWQREIRNAVAALGRGASLDVIRLQVQAAF